MRLTTPAHNNALYLIICGLATGWLVGLSVSPVLQILVGAFIGLVVAAIGALAGLRVDREQMKDANQSSEAPAHGIVVRERVVKVDLMPLAAFTAALALGASLGIIARTNAIFGPNGRAFAHQWSGIGLDESQVKRRLFDHLYPPPSAAAVLPKDPQFTAGLFAVSVQNCNLLSLKQGTELRTRLIAVGGEKLKLPLEKCHSDECLEAIKELICPQGN